MEEYQYTIKLSLVPDCCKAKLLHSFGGQGGLLGHSREEPIPIETVRKDIEHYIRGCVKSHVLIFLNYKQEPIYGNLLRELGFEMVAAGRPGLGLFPNYLYVWRKYPT